MMFRRLLPLLLAATLAACAQPKVSEGPAASQGNPATAQSDTWVTRPGEKEQITAAPQGAIEPQPLDPATPLPDAGPAPVLPPPVVIGGGIKIALLAPLSGRNAAVGQALQNAGELAVFDIGTEGFVLLPIDTEKAGAAAAAQEAIRQGAQAILGPLFAAQVPEVATVAMPANIPVITFSNDRMVAGPGVYVLGLSPLQALERTIAFARNRGYTDFAALVSDDALGVRVGAMVQEFIPASGGHLAKVETYSAGTNDFSSVARRASGGAAKEKTGPGYRALVLSESGPKLKQLAPWMPYHNIDPALVKVIGTPTWDDPSLGSEPGLAGAWFAAPDPAGRAAFEAKFRDTYGRVPPRVATIGYDGVALLAVIARMTNGPNFTPDQLTNPSGFAGVDGIFRFLPSGISQRGLAVFEVQRGGGKMIEGAPGSFEAVVN
ncbi:penicillin-binding protein activator [Lacibacterium aquatile]|uniref:Penicillin-binding protein activator n=1 Tax=Lacibacterium aquatile TaxID=1168082 RepID=A0ABW5E1D0_9PROT